MRWGAALALSVAALLVSWKVSIVAPIQFVGHGDAAAYATMLQPWVAGEIPGLERVYEGDGLTLYAIHYEALPAELAPPRRRPG